MANSRIKESMRQLVFSLASVEPVDECINVFLQVVATDAIEFAWQEAFQIAYDNVHHGQPFIGQFERRNARLLLKLVGEGIERRQRIASHGDSGNQTVVEVAHRGQVEVFYGLHGQITGSITAAFDRK